MQPMLFLLHAVISFVLVFWGHPSPTRLYSSQQRHVFSQPSQLDTFSLQLTGKTLLTATATLTITDYKGQELHRETFPAVELIGFAMDADELKVNAAGAEAIIRKRTDTYFANEAFFQPAIPPGAVFDAHRSEKVNWLLIKSDPTAVGFGYLVGEENNRRIAWSRKLGRVVVYYSCC